MNAGNIRHQFISAITQYNSLKLKSAFRFPNEFLQFSMLSPKPALLPFVRLGSDIKCATETHWRKYNWYLKITRCLFLCTCPASRSREEPWEMKVQISNCLLFGMGQLWAASLSVPQFACGVARPGDECLVPHRDMGKAHFQYGCQHGQIDDGQENNVLYLGFLLDTENWCYCPGCLLSVDTCIYMQKQSII